MTSGAYRLVFYRVPRGEYPARDFLDSLPVGAKVKSAAWLGLLQERGPELRRPYADVVEGPIRELRVTYGRLEIRFLYFITGKDIVLTGGFLKKTGRVPEGEIGKAMKCRNRWLYSGGGDE